MKRYLIERIGWAGKGKEVVRLIGTAATTARDAAYPGEAINDALRAAFDCGTQLVAENHRRIEPIAHPFCPYVRDGKVYPRFVIREEGELPPVDGDAMVQGLPRPRGCGKLVHGGGHCAMRVSHSGACLPPPLKPSGRP